MPRMRAASTRTYVSGIGFGDSESARDRGDCNRRKLVEELRMHLAWRWFTGLGSDQEMLHHSTFSKNRHGRFQESKLFEQLFEQIVRQCVDVGLVEGKHLSVDGR